MGPVSKCSWEVCLRPHKHKKAVFPSHTNKNIVCQSSCAKFES